MSDTILITYASRYGSTQEVAEKIAVTLSESGLTVDVQPARQVKTLQGYRAIVLGTPLYIGSWLKDAHRFLKRHQAALEKLPVAIFSLGPTHGEDPIPTVRPQMDKELAKYPWLKPVSTELFGGQYDPDKLRFPDTLLGKVPASPLYEAPASDLRDWDAIRNWAQSLDL